MSIKAIYLLFPYMLMPRYLIHQVGCFQFIVVEIVGGKLDRGEVLPIDYMCTYIPIDSLLQTYTTSSGRW